MITLASDFGSPYPAAMKGVICAHSDARIEDIAHDFPRHDVRAAAFWLRELLPYFPPAVHCVVVDPGVGTDRDAIVLRVGDHALVAPDNGVVLPVARELAGLAPGDSLEHDDVSTFVIDDAEADSTTFHGRDVFAPAAAALHEAGVQNAESLDRLTPTDSANLVDCTLPEANIENGRAEGEILVVDDFGNAITNIPGEFLAGASAVTVNGEHTPVGDTFAAVSEDDRLVTVGSHGYVECDVNQGRGDEAFGLEPGDGVILERC
ncbi:S-adenosyl-l-methionine hydroxide adenosyltransferase family protein [Haloarchaeobius sp. HME9146]|uniref:SAM hydrolase/SAM-dependent halogenase family protein n=1 Tax=Haloarchaeobius sp. HME9146 TaxID=2978732 RepID=UPI0021BE26EC|nr:SAM-dependent chlorinase/fluorinase [Haloarchaeobius sp. HME9146]MCT9095790.1 SAM-dependent chlorinase/fluorinase [Haloarchaeobius sp. HME9146]